MLARTAAELDVPFTAPAFAASALGDTAVFPHHVDAIPPGLVDAGSYTMRFAWTRADLAAVQALRYRVFSAEHGDSATAEPVAPHVAHTVEPRLDADVRDPWFHHLMICERRTGDVVGTYRVQTAVMAASRHGFYSSAFFELGGVPGTVLADGIEVGRACVDPAHRTGRVLRLLWRGIARYVQWNSKRYVFGCCSLPGTDVTVAQDAWRIIHARGLLHDRVFVRPRADVRALPDDGRARPLTTAAALASTLPPLLEGYLALGARVCSAPAVDRAFGTTDLLVLLDIEAMDPRVYRSLFV